MNGFEVVIAILGIIALLGAGAILVDGEVGFGVFMGIVGIVLLGIAFISAYTASNGLPLEFLPDGTHNVVCVERDGDAFVLVAVAQDKQERSYLLYRVDASALAEAPACNGERLTITVDRGSRYIYAETPR